MTGLPQRQGSQDFGTMHSQLAVEQESIRNSFLHTARVRGTSFSFGVLYKHSQQHRLAKGAKVWVKVRDRSGLHNRSVADLRVVHILVAMSGLTWMSLQPSGCQ